MLTCFILGCSSVGFITAKGYAMVMIVELAHPRVANLENSGMSTHQALSQLKQLKRTQFFLVYLLTIHALCHATPHRLAQNLNPAAPLSH